MGKEHEMLKLTFSQAAVAILERIVMPFTISMEEYE
jgi:hypothetical protein